MSATSRGSSTMSKCARFGFTMLFAVHGLILLTPRLSGQAQPLKPDAATPAKYIPVRQPFTSAELDWVKSEAKRFVDSEVGQAKVVFDFNPDGRPNASSDFGQCYELANFLLTFPKLQANTVAFVHGEVKGHMVLPVLACWEIVMGKDSKFGPVVDTNASPLAETEQFFYRTVAEKRNYYPAVVFKLFDKEVQLWQGLRGNDTCFFDKRRVLEEETRAGKKFVDQKQVTGIGFDQTAIYNAPLADRLGLCKKQPVDTKTEIERLYTLRWTIDSDRPPKAGWIRLSGPVTKGMSEEVHQCVRQAVGRGDNYVFVLLGCRGGDPSAARDMAGFFRDLKDDQGRNPVISVAYLAEDAGEMSTLIALGCTEIVMHRKAQLGGFQEFIDRRPNIDWFWNLDIGNLIKDRYPEALGKALVDPSVALHQVKNKKTGQVTLLDAPQLDPTEWQNLGWVRKPGVCLTLEAPEAKQLGLAKQVFEEDSDNLMPWLKKEYGVSEMKEIPHGWLHWLAQKLRSPEVSYLLVILGITGLILELKIPGFGLPGVLAAICFVLYFWAHSQQMEGSLTLLAVLLFLLGLILIGVEVFLVPGLGITGISGIALLIVSLALVTVVKKPETTAEWIDFGTTLTTLGFCLVASLGGALVVAWYLPHIPWANRLVLAPPAGPTAALLDEPHGPDYSAMLGTIGEAATTLRPAGKARFGDEFLDVVAEGSYVNAGARVQIIEVEGNRVVVKEV